MNFNIQQFVRGIAALLCLVFVALSVLDGAIALAIGFALLSVVWAILFTQDTESLKG